MIGMFLDFEATDKTPDTARVTQAAFSLYDMLACREVYHYSALMYDDTEPQVIHPDAQAITGITVEQLKKFGKYPMEVFTTIIQGLHEAAFLVAHNGHNYDFPLLKKELTKANLTFPECNKYGEEILLVDTKSDIPYPKKIEVRKLTYLAAEHGFLNPMAHSARHDVDAMAFIFLKYPLTEILHLARSKNIYIQAEVSFQDKDKARDRQYRWDGKQKVWWKQIKEMHLAAEEAEANFPVIIRNDFKPSDV